LKFLLDLYAAAPAACEQLRCAAFNGITRSAHARGPQRRAFSPFHCHGRHHRLLLLQGSAVGGFSVLAFFGALEVCAALSFILCVVGEFLAAKAGLGYYLRSASNNIDAAAMFAALIVLSLLATALALTVRLAHHRTVFWKYQRH
jgi:hypothetical protein